MFDDAWAGAESTAHSVALACLERGIRAAHPSLVSESSLSVEEGRLVVSSGSNVDDLVYDLESYDRVLVLGVGTLPDSSHANSRVLGDHLSGGVVVTDDVEPTDIIEVIEGDHPVPTERCVDGARRVLSVAESATADDLVVACITGVQAPCSRHRQPTSRCRIFSRRRRRCSRAVPRSTR